MKNTNFLFLPLLFFFYPIKGSCETCFNDTLDNDYLMLYIKKDLSLKKEYKNLWDSIKLIKARTETSFEVLSVCENLIQQDYIGGFSFGETETNKKNKLIIEKIRDSVKNLSDSLNKSCELSATNAGVPMIKRSKNEIVLFCSKVCHNMLFVKLIPAFGIISNKDHYEFYGEAYTYLFLIDKDDKIKKIYRGNIFYN